MYRAVIDEGAEKFEPPLKVQARDRDKTSKITYSLLDSDNKGIFKIDPDTGDVTIVKKATLDMANHTGEKISLTVRASDGIFSDEAVITVIVRDVNNNAPVFIHDLYTASIPELSEIGKFFFFNSSLL